MPRILFAAAEARWAQYEAPLRTALAEAGIEARLDCDASAPETVDYMIFAPNGAIEDFRPFCSLKAVLNLWAGVEDVVGNPTLTVPLARMVDTGLTEGMVEWCVGQTLRHHLGLDRQITTQDGVWRHFDWIPPLARNRKVCVLGLGALGSAVARTLVSLNFQVSGYSRSPKQIDGVTCFSGADMTEALRDAEIAIALFPYTPATDSILDADAFAAMAHGGVILNPGRGGLIDDAALLAALDSGQIGQATLDVFRTEPLPPDHAYWAHPKVTVTPHIASETRPETAARVIVENIRRGEAGLPFINLVDRVAGY
ncbi:2-hydroxyacid dehydrogenase [Tropicimonas sp. S265A]|uniref:2-hydroxyacid dehydrogenase n=1 Tax=Tropicimonas sp. S265A TaxID=3415134 RepID=UPI003C7AAAE4